MLAALIIVFREIIEAGLVVGIVLAATRGVPRRGLWVGYGILGGIAGACLVAAFASSISAAMQGAGQELFNVTILLIAVLMLAWHNVWMARHGREMAAHIKAVGEAVAAGHRSLVALSIVVGIAVLREGAEIVLFLFGIAISGNDTAAMMAAGGTFGLLLGGVGAALMYFGLLRIPARHLFQVTSWLIALLAAGMAAQAMAFLQQAQVVTSFTQMVWDTSNFISDGSVIGKSTAYLDWVHRPANRDATRRVRHYACDDFYPYEIVRSFDRYSPSAKRALIPRTDGRRQCFRANTPVLGRIPPALLDALLQGKGRRRSLCPAKAAS